MTETDKLKTIQSLTYGGGTVIKLTFKGSGYELWVSDVNDSKNNIMYSSSVMEDDIFGRFILNAASYFKSKLNDQ